ncbi:MAG TPA: hypothetical protein V6C78_09040 [Crinalium sp.]
MKFTLIKAYVRKAIAFLLLLGIGGCIPPQSPLTSSTPSSNTNDGINLIALLLVRKNNLKNEYRAEIYPIALLLNGHYLEVSEDVTRDLKENSIPDITPDRLIQLNEKRIIVNAVQSFTVVSNDQELGNFQVEKPIISQFFCSSLITGQGHFQGQTPLSAIFEQIPEEQTSQFKGTARNQTFDESWRTAIALNHLPSPLAQPPVVSQAEESEYRQAALQVGKDVIGRLVDGQSLPGEAVVETIQVLDLNRDGTPEIFANIKQGSRIDENASQSTNPTGFATLWLTYKSGNPQLLETIQASASATGIQRSPHYEFLGSVDMTGDGIEEVLMKRTDYEYTVFEIYEYKNNRLNRVFNGAGFGC